jgi:MFS family permease
MRRIFGLVPNVFFLGLVSLFNDFSAEMILAVMPAFLVSLGATPIFIGFLEGFADALASVLKIVSGWFSDKIQRRKIVSVGGYAASLATRWLLLFVGNIWHVFALRAVDRVGKGFREPPRDALLAESVPQEELGRSFGYQRAMDAMGGVVGPLAAVIVFPLLGGNFHALFLLAAIIGFFAVGSFFFVKEPVAAASTENKFPRLLIPSLKDFSGSFRKYLVAIFIFGLGTLPISLMLLKAQDVGSLAIYLPLLYLIYNISFSLCAVPFGNISDRVGEENVITWGFGVAIVSYVLLALSTNTPAVIIGFIIFGIYSAMTEGVRRALISRLAPREHLATGQGLLGAAIGIASLFAGVFGGWLWTVYGSRIAFLAGAGLMTLGLLAFSSARRGNGGASQDLTE